MDDGTRGALDGHDAKAVEELADPLTDPADVLATRHLAEAERAVAANVADDRQHAGVTAARRARTTEERLRAWRAATGT